MNFQSLSCLLRLGSMGCGGRVKKFCPGSTRGSRVLSGGSPDSLPRKNRRAADFEHAGRVCSPIQHLRPAAFNLIEVALALGIIGIGLLSVFGLLSAALNTSRDARDSYQLGLIVNQIVNDRRSSTFNAASGIFGITALDPGGNDTIYFRKDGSTNSPITSGAFPAYYRVRILSQPAYLNSDKFLAEFHLRVEYPCASVRSNVTWFSTIIAKTNP